MLHGDDVLSLTKMIKAFAKSENLNVSFGNVTFRYGGEPVTRKFEFSNGRLERTIIIKDDEVSNIYETFEAIREDVKKAFEWKPDVYNVTYNPYWAAKYVMADILGTQNATQLKAKFFPTPKIKKVHFNGPCTIVLWTDDTKTIVRAENEVFDPEKGLAMAIAKRFLGTNKSGGNYYDEIKKWTKDYYELQETMEKLGFPVNKAKFTEVTEEK